MPDVTLEVLKNIHAELREMKMGIREMKTDIGELRVEMRSGFETLSQAIMTGFVENEDEHGSLDARVTRIEKHLKRRRGH